MASDIADQDEGERKKSVGPVQFLGEVRAEGRKVTWATRQEVLVSTIMVLLLSAAAALFFFVVDLILRFVVAWILNLG